MQEGRGSGGLGDLLNGDKEPRSMSFSLWDDQRGTSVVKWGQVRFLETQQKKKKDHRIQGGEGDAKKRMVGKLAAIQHERCRQNRLGYLERREKRKEACNDHGTPTVGAEPTSTRRGSENEKGRNKLSWGGNPRRNKTSCSGGEQDD